MDVNNKQIEIFVDYFKSGEKNIKDFKVGVEFEHFIIDKNTLNTISYYGNDGVEDTLKKLLKKEWLGKYEGNHLLGLVKDGTTITLEPGSQIELSIKACSKIEELEKLYIDFLQDVIPILEEKNQLLTAIGYHPKTKIENVKFIPKSRYKYMSEYLIKQGNLAHNMMKGTSSTQVTLDFHSEIDYIKKFRVANALSSVVAAIFDNAPFFEGKLWDKNCVRIKIWENCDPDRCGVVDDGLNMKFGYEEYAKYILNIPPILIDDNKSVEFTGKTPYKELFDINDYSKEELEHVMTMAFPDVRTKKFIEIRMADSVPYPLNFSVIALWKGLLYDEKNLNKLYEYLINITNDDIKKSKIDAINKGLDGEFNGKSNFEIGKIIVGMAKDGLNEKEKKYLIPLENILNNRNTPAMVTKEKLGLGKDKAIEWCVLNNILRGEIDVCK